MKPRHAAALALMGWYLLIPTPGHYDAPLSYWGHYDSYDTAKECSEAQLELVKRAENPNWKDPRLPVGSVKASECIASDDPRLKQQ